MGHTARRNQAYHNNLFENMSTTFRLNADELEPSFVEKIKLLFAHKDIAVTIYEEDETDYLSSTQANREHLDRSIADIRAGRNMVEVNPSIFE
jgi:hypothetical protein